jgi:hypothetical protein
VKERYIRTVAYRGGVGSSNTPPPLKKILGTPLHERVSKRVGGGGGGGGENDTTSVFGFWPVRRTAKNDCTERLGIH